MGRGIEDTEVGRKGVETMGESRKNASRPRSVKLRQEALYESWNSRFEGEEEESGKGKDEINGGGEKFLSFNDRNGSRGLDDTEDVNKSSGKGRVESNWKLERSDWKKASCLLVPIYKQQKQRRNRIAITGTTMIFVLEHLLFVWSRVKDVSPLSIGECVDSLRKIPEENGKWKTGKDLFFSYSEMIKMRAEGGE